MSPIATPEAFVDRIYEAGLVPSLWPNVLGELGSIIGGNGGLLFGVRDSYVSATVSAEHVETIDIFLNDGWAERDLGLKRIMKLDCFGFITDSDLFSDIEIATDPVYENFFRRYGMGYRAATMIPLPSGDSIGISMPRHHDNGPVPRDVVSFLDALRPHIARAALTANRLGFERARAQADALQAIGLPGAVLGAQGRMLVANALFESLMPSLFQDRTQRLTVTDPIADSLLASALSPLQNNTGVKSIPLGATQERVAMVLHLVPVRGMAHDIFTQAIALLIVTPVDRAAVPSAEVLQGLFDLTPSEARVARGIGKALTIDDVALAQGISRETVRSHLKAVLSKTGLVRQQQLVRLLTGAALSI